MKSIQIFLIIVFTSLVYAFTSLAFTLSVGAQTRQIDFSSTWELDSKASDSMDAIFDLQKISWIKKKLGANLDAEPVIKATADGLNVTFDNIAGKTIQQLFFYEKPRIFGYTVSN